MVRRVGPELRLYREMAAQEKANKLPVKMSGVLASLMLPALILLTVRIPAENKALALLS